MVPLRKKFKLVFQNGSFKNSYKLVFHNGSFKKKVVNYGTPKPGLFSGSKRSGLVV